jgi:hypothetical protein
MKKSYIKNYNYLLAGLVVTAIFSSRTTARATYIGDIGGIESQTPPALVTADDTSGAYPIITQILSMPSTSDGYTYTSWSFLANDTTGSVDIFGKLPTGSTFVPSVGEGLTLSGTYSPFDGIPEIETLTSIAAEPSTYTVPLPALTTIPTLTGSLPNLPSSAAEYVMQLDNVVISGAATFPTHANGTFTITDSGGNTMTLYEWASSYSVVGAAFGGKPVPLGTAGEVDITGFADVFESSEVEFVPLTITSVVPEPSVMNLLGVGGAGGLLALASRFRKKA